MPDKPQWEVEHEEAEGQILQTLHDKLDCIGEKLNELIEKRDEDSKKLEPIYLAYIDATILGKWAKRGAVALLMCFPAWAAWIQIHTHN